MRTATDPASLSQASVFDHPSDHILEAFCPRCGSCEDATCPGCGGHLEPAGASVVSPVIESWRSEIDHRRGIAMAAEAHNSKFFLTCYLIATGDAAAEGISMTDVARQWSVTKATVSKYCRTICERLGTPPSRYMRKEETVAKLRITNRRPRMIAAPKL